MAKWIIVLLVFITTYSFADRIRLKEEGASVEVIEESANDFIVRIPKGEVISITRDKPTEADLWKLRRVLWEDTGDYLVISIPKERVTGAGEAKTLDAVLEDTGVKKQETGSMLIGRVIRDGQPLPRCVVKIVKISTGGWFGGKKEKEAEFTTITDEGGKYEFKNIPYGDYDVYWKPSAEESWVRRLSDKPNITVEAGQTVEFPDIIL